MKCTTNTDIGFFGANIRNQINEFTNDHIGPHIYVPELFSSVLMAKGLIEISVYFQRFGRNV